MKLILFILVLALLALVAGLHLAGAGLAVISLVVLIGDILARQPLPACAGDCNQGRACSCEPREVQT